MFYNIHTHKSSGQKEVLEIVNQYPDALDTSIPAYSIGIHPWYIVSENIAADLAIIDQRLSEVNCYALGECGLDKTIGIAPELQTAVFEQQLLLAEKHCKPVIIHCVKAFQELIAIQKKQVVSVPMIIHGFSKNSTIAKQLTDHGFYLSFGKHLLYNPELKSVFQSIPEERILLETDTAEETIQQVYNIAAKYLNTDILNIENRITNTFKTIFKHGSMDGKSGIVI